MENRMVMVFILIKMVINIKVLSKTIRKLVMEFLKVLLEKFIMETLLILQDMEKEHYNLKQVINILVILKKINDKEKDNLNGHQEKFMLVIGKMI